MRWDVIQRNVTMELCGKMERSIFLGDGHVHIAAVKLLRDLFSGTKIPPGVQAYIDKGFRLGEALVEAAKDEIERRIDAWDIRGVGQLRKLAPEAFPKNMRTCQLVADIDDKGRWVVFPSTP